MGFAVAGFEVVDHFEDEPGAHRGEAGFELCGVFVGVDGRALLSEKRAGVEAGRHVDDAVAGFGFAAEDGPLHGRGAAILGQQRAVQVDAAETGGGERFGAEDFAVIADDEQVGASEPMCDWDSGELTVSGDQTVRLSDSPAR